MSRAVWTMSRWLFKIESTSCRRMVSPGRAPTGWGGGTCPATGATCPPAVKHFNWLAFFITTEFTKLQEHTIPTSFYLYQKLAQLTHAWVDSWHQAKGSLLSANDFIHLHVELPYDFMDLKIRYPWYSCTSMLHSNVRNICKYCLWNVWFNFHPLPGILYEAIVPLRYNMFDYHFIIHFLLNTFQDGDSYCC